MKKRKERKMSGNQKLFLKGVSNPRGFKLVDRINKIRVYSSGYKKSSQYLLLRVNLIILVPYLMYYLIGLTLVILRFVNWRIFDFIIWISPCINIIISINLSICFLSFLFGRKELSEWHATEHKIAYYLKHRGRELTVEELRKCPTISEFCGSGNKDLERPSDKKLEEGVRVGQEFLSKLF